MPVQKPRDLAVTDGQFARDVIAGLTAQRKTLPCKYLYDKQGSELFDRICSLPEYYLTRTETGIMRQHAREMAEVCGRNCGLVEFGSGSSSKTQLLLEQLPPGGTYVPIDISGEHLLESARTIERRFPDLEVVPVIADFTQLTELPRDLENCDRRVVYFPGSTIGNFAPAEATRLMQQIRRVVGPNGRALIGVDLAKSEEVLIPAYADSEGVTAEFNLNLIRRIDREMGLGLKPERFRHEARFNPDESRMEMHLVAVESFNVEWSGQTIQFRANESIHTENSYKYTVQRFASIAASARFEVVRSWCDQANYFSVQYLVAA